MCPRHPVHVQGGKDALDALNNSSLFVKEPLIMGLFCGK